MRVLQLSTAVALAISTCQAGGADHTLPVLTDRPIVAIFAHPMWDVPAGCVEPCEHVVGSYVKWLAGAGARSTVISYNATEEEVVRIVDQVNGVLFPGGGHPLPDSARYALAHARDLAAKGDHFPVWGTCLGFEWILDAVATKQGEHSIMDQGFDTRDAQLPVMFTDDAPKSKMLTSMSARSLQWIHSQPSTQNNHKQGLKPSTFQAHPVLGDAFLLTSVSKDGAGVDFVATIEGRELPWYGSQFHPEKTIYEFGTRKNGHPYLKTNHQARSLLAMQELATFFVDQTRFSGHKFSTLEAERDALSLVLNAPRSAILSPGSEEVFLYSQGSPWLPAPAVPGPAEPTTVASTLSILA